MSEQQLIELIQLLKLLSTMKELLPKDQQYVRAVEQICKNIVNP